MIQISPVKQIKIGELDVKIFSSRIEMGKAAAEDVYNELCRIEQLSRFIRVVFAAAPSQNEFLDYLTQYKNFNWAKVESLHMDEYIGLPEKSILSFGYFLKDKLFSKLPFGRVHYISPDPKQPEIAIEGYRELLNEKPPDIVVLGIGENGHIAFNDPPVADFNDPESVKIVELDQICRQQQVNDKCFATLAEVPGQAITLTVPALMAGLKIVCIVPGKLKSQAVYNTLYGEISEKVPASILRRHPNATLYLDTDSASKLA